MNDLESYELIRLEERVKKLEEMVDLLRQLVERLDDKIGYPRPLR